MTQEDFEVVAETKDGNEALSLAEKLMPDILLLDLAMPKVSGMETLRRLAYNATPVYTILLTAAIHPLEITHALRLGARGVVLKASPPEVLLKSVRSVCAGGYWVDDELLAGWGRFGDEPKNRSELTPREVEIISEIKAGRSNREIAHKLSISDETVKRHLSNIFEKLGVSSRLELALLASKHDLSP
jgi:DNA-binding NarL/FixJ family response regulator